MLLGNIEKEAFSTQPTIERIDLMENLITSIAGRAFYGLSKLQYINLAFNKINHLNSDVFEGKNKMVSI